MEAHRLYNIMLLLCSELAFLVSPENTVDYYDDLFKLSFLSNPVDKDPDTSKCVTSIHLAK